MVDFLFLEDLQKIGNWNNLSFRLQASLDNMRKDKNAINSATHPLFWKDLSIDTYSTLIIHLKELKDSCVSHLSKYGKIAKAKEKAIQIINLWKIVYKEIQEIDDSIDEYNKKFPNYSLKKVEELLGIKLEFSVCTENYFPY